MPRENSELVRDPQATAATDRAEVGAMRSLPSRVRHEVTPHDAAARASAHVYGNIVTLASLLSLSKAEAISLHGVMIVLGVAASTFVAHALANGIGRRLQVADPMSLGEVARETRNSLPITVAAILPASILFLAWILAVPAVYAQSCAALVIVVRFALTGVVLARYRGLPGAGRVAAIGFLLAAAGAAATGLKVLA